MIIAPLGINCPACGNELPNCIGRGSRAPRSGDVGMCDNCAAAFRFGEGLQSRLLTPEEEAELLASPHGAYYETERIKAQRRGLILPRRKS